MSIKISQINGCDIVDAELTDKVAEYSTELKKLQANLSGLQTVSPTELNAFKTEFERWTTEHDTDAEETHIEIQQSIDALTTNIASVYATQSWVENKNYLTEHQDLSGIESDISALKEKVSTIAGDDEALDTLTEVKEALAGKVDSAAYETYKTDVALAVADKESIENVNAIKERVTALENSTAAADALETFKTETTATLEGKADKIEFEATKKVVDGNAYEITFPDLTAAATYDIYVYEGGEKAGFTDDVATKVESADDTFTAISKKGVVRFNGTGKFYFKVVAHDGYKVTRVKVDKGDYDEIELDSTTNVYTIKDIRSDLELQIFAADSTTPKYNVTFVLEHGTVKAYSDEFVTLFDDISDISVEQDNNVYFEIIPDIGYSVALDTSGITGNYNKLKTDDTNMYHITKIKSDVTIAPVFTAQPKTLADYAITDAYTKDEVYTKTEVDAKVSSVYKYKGSVEKYENLPTEDLTIGDVWNVEDVGLFKHDMNYAWNGSAWDALGSSVDLSDYSTTAQADAKYATVESVSELASKSEVSTISAKLPDVPADNGTYVLKAVRTADGIAYSWVAETAA